MRTWQTWVRFRLSSRITLTITTWPFPRRQNWFSSRMPSSMSPGVCMHPWHHWVSHICRICICTKHSFSGTYTVKTLTIQVNNVNDLVAMALFQGMEYNDLLELETKALIRVWATLTQQIMMYSPQGLEHLQNGWLCWLFPVCSGYCQRKELLMSAGRKSDVLYVVQTHRRAVMKIVRIYRLLWVNRTFCFIFLLLVLLCCGPVILQDCPHDSPRERQFLAGRGGRNRQTVTHSVSSSHVWVPLLRDWAEPRLQLWQLPWGLEEALQDGWLGEQRYGLPVYRLPGMKEDWWENYFFLFVHPAV